MTEARVPDEPVRGSSAVVPASGSPRRSLLLRLAAIVVGIQLFSVVGGFFAMNSALHFTALIACMGLAVVVAPLVALRALRGRWYVRVVGALLAGALMGAALLALLPLSTPLYGFGLETAARSGFDIDLPAVLEWSENALARDARGELRRVEAAGSIDGIYYAEDEVHPQEIAPGVMTGMLERRGPWPSVYIADAHCVRFQWRGQGLRVCPHAAAGAKVKAFAP